MPWYIALTFSGHLFLKRQAVPSRIHHLDISTARSNRPDCKCPFRRCTRFAGSIWTWKMDSHRLYEQKDTRHLCCTSIKVFPITCGHPPVSVMFGPFGCGCSRVRRKWLRKAAKSRAEYDGRANRPGSLCCRPGKGSGAKRNCIQRTDVLGPLDRAIIPRRVGFPSCCIRVRSFAAVRWECDR